MDEIEIRPLEAGQQDHWLPLWRAYQVFYEVDIPEDVTAVTWARLLDPAEPMSGAIAWSGTCAVGFVHHIRHRSCWSAGDYCYLEDLFVDPTLRGGGVGRALIAHVYDVAARAGCTQVYWLTHEANTKAQALYDQLAERSGFIQYSHALPQNEG